MEFCTEYIGMNAECGEEAVTKRDGFPLCAEHAHRWDALTEMAANWSDGE